MARLKESAKLPRNLLAFLDMIAVAEGTDDGRQLTRNKGYDVIVGGQLFADYTDHPRILVRLPRLNIFSTAAGRYQLLSRYWDAYRKQLNLPDFSPENQDRVAIQQIRERGALPDIAAGRFDEAVRKVRNIWASLPGAGYGQHEQPLARLREVYVKAGGTLHST